MSDQATAPAQAKTPADGRDPNVKIPARVRAEAKRSEELMKQRQDAMNEAMGATGDAPLADGGLVITDAPPVAPAAQPITQATQPTIQEPSKPTENDFNAMKGRFERATKDSIRMSEEITNLRNVIAAMQAAPTPMQAAPAELQPQSMLTPQEISDYGSEFLDVVGKKAREIAGAEIAGLKAQLERLQAGVATNAQMSAAQARDSMIATLDQNLPEWRVLNNDPNFISWLRLPDPFSGAIRHDLLKGAYEQNNSLRVAAFFNGFLAEEAAVAPASNTPPAVPGTQQGKVPLETFAAPSRAKSAAANAPAEKPIITRAQVSMFYTDIAAGKYRGRDEEKARLEAEIFSASSEGRLR